MNDEIDPNRRIVIACGSGVPSAAELHALIGKMIPPGMEIDFREGGTSAVGGPSGPQHGYMLCGLPGVPDERRNEIAAWNKAVEQRNYERKLRKLEKGRNK